MINLFCKVIDFENNNHGDFNVCKRPSILSISWMNFKIINVMIIHKDAETMCYRSTYSPEKVRVYAVRMSSIPFREQACDIDTTCVF